MAAVDPNADVEVVTAADSVVARVPLAEAPGPWMKEYMPLARAEGLAAEVREEPGKILLVVQVAVGLSEPEVFALLDSARYLVDQAKVAAIDRTAAATATERHIQKWWSHQRGDAAL